MERFNRTSRHEVLHAYVFESLDQVRETSAELMREYNEERPHDALAGLPPTIYRVQLEAGVLLWNCLLDGGTYVLNGETTLLSSNRMLKKSISGVLASLRGSTYRSVRLASSLAAALLDGLFEHPEVILASVPYGKFQPYVQHQPSFPAAC